MGIDLIAALNMESPWVVWPLVALGLGMVIFIHELGHFLVAKWCGVKCEKFFVGFDIAGLKISKKWGETEYGIGILPLGGYVKMLGQDDNPYKAREEMERAKAAKEAELSKDAAPDEDVAAKAEAALAEDSPKYDPRSYLAMSVPKRMAIISAGVIMNVIFAFVVSVWAYSLGVDYTPPVIGSMTPGDPAWSANPPLAIGDDIIAVNGITEPRFTKDLRTEVIFSEMDQGVKLLVKRPGIEEPFNVTVYPELIEGLPSIGLGPAATTTLEQKYPTMPDTPAAAAKPAFEGGDRIVAINGQEIDAHADLNRYLVNVSDKTVQITVEREAATKGQPPQRLTIDVGPNPMKTLGLVMKMGEITAIRPGSPAAEKGLKPGQRITRITVTGTDQELPLDPVLLPHQLRRLIGKSVDINLIGENDQRETVTDVPLRNVLWEEEAARPGAPMSAPVLGVTYRVLNRVSEVTPGSPAAASNAIKPGDEITAIRFVQPEIEDEEKRSYRKQNDTVKLGPEEPNWPYAMFALQRMTPDTKIELTVKGQEQPVVLEPQPSDEYFLSVRGFRLKEMTRTRQAQSFGEALALGGRETWEALTMVVGFLRKVGRQIPVTAMGGPVSIVRVAGASAERGLPELLIFLAMLSANLAVINSLPIPVLDGGHFLFLLIEGIRGKPVNERVFIAFTYLGFAFILTLMMFVLGLDFFHLTR